ncbi:unnamed protein product [Onchocerca flexuosa]|uniref:Uncharacterized protein n=1 Tax=Onchocerca flexuosa TaxID=387005 RepID=A0A183I524_9BILA|nr:unnamed protein product [Onchocerca flexuosa]
MVLAICSFTRSGETFAPSAVCYGNLSGTRWWFFRIDWFNRSAAVLH